MDGTRRCLFPVADDDYYYHQHHHAADASFDSEFFLNSEEMLRATDPDSSIEDVDDYNWKNPKLPPRDSPVGVVELFPTSWFSTIHVDENGAEVTLGLRDIMVRTPERKGRSAFQGNSLMDVCTPTPPSTKPKQTSSNRRQSFADRWCGTTYMNCGVDDTTREYQCVLPTTASLQDLISKFLGDSEGSMKWNGCSIWQDFSFSVGSESHHGGYPTDDVDDNNNDKTRESSSQLSNLRLRALSLRTRQSRVHQMRRDLSPFAHSPSRTPSLGRSRSFSGSAPSSSSTTTMEPSEKRQTAVSALRFAGSWLCTLPENALSESPKLVRYNPRDGKSVQDICGYDSDPEDFARRRSPKRARHNHSQSVTAMNNSLSMDPVVAIQEFMNQSFTLIYHPSARDVKAGKGLSCPIAMDAWLERGQLLHDLIQPKWFFRPKSTQVYRRGSLVNRQAVKSIELLDITRLLEVSVVDRTIYPFAKPYNTFILRNVDGAEFCFEAQSREECHLVVYSLKMAIARFGAMVITSNSQVYDEFFASKDTAFVHEDEQDEVDSLLQQSFTSNEC